jgi:hypothetical protein
LYTQSEMENIVNSIMFDTPEERKRMNDMNIARLKRVAAISRYYSRSKRDEDSILELKRLTTVIERDANDEIELSTDEHSRVVHDIEGLLRVPILARANEQSFEELAREGKVEKVDGQWHWIKSKESHHE